MTRALAAALVALSALAATAPARAQHRHRHEAEAPPPDPTPPPVEPDPNADAARAKFEEGLRLLDAQDYAHAADAFVESLALRESPAARYDLAVAFRGLGQPRNAVEALLRFLAAPTGVPQEMVNDAAFLLGQQERLIVHATIATHGPAPVEVTVDGEPVAVVATQVVELDPGPHVFAAHADGREPVVVRRELAAGAHETVAIELENAEDRRGHLEVRAAPETAEIFVDGTSRAHGSFAIDLDAGVHALRVSASGFVGAARRVTVRAGGRETLDLSLAPVHGGVDPWAVFGVSAAAVATTVLVVVLAVVLSQPSYAPYDTGSTGVVVEALR